MKTSMEFAEVGDGYVVGELGGDLLEAAIRDRHENCLRQLERDVIDAAVKWFHDDGERTPLAKATAALIRERKGK